MLCDYAELDLKSIFEEAKSRWLRPNEIHAILFNHMYFPIHVKPVNLPKSGEIHLFDRKKLRNFRKDGHNWKKKNDGKTVKEAHEHLKVGNEERIHVYYAHGQDNATFVRRCYWLLDKSMEHIVLVHYRETCELLDPSAAPVNSNSSSGLTELHVPFLTYEETESGSQQSNTSNQLEYIESIENVTAVTLERRLREINTLDWDELLVDTDPSVPIAYEEGKSGGVQQQNPVMINVSKDDGSALLMNLPTELSSGWHSACPETRSDSINGDILDGSYNHAVHSQLMMEAAPNNSGTLFGGQSFSITQGGGQDQDRRWMNSSLTVESPGSVNDSIHESSISSAQNSMVPTIMDQPQSADQIFTITDISPEWAFSCEKTKILLTGYFHQGFGNLLNSNLYCVCGSSCVPVEIVQTGVMRCILPPHSPGQFDLYLSTERLKPVSQLKTFEYRSSLQADQNIPSDNLSEWDEFRNKMRLVRLLFSSSKTLNILSAKVSEHTVNEAKKFSEKTSHTASSWALLKQSVDENKISLHQAEEILFEQAIRNRLQDWLLERIIEEQSPSDYDEQGLGVLHLCAILNYTWAVYLYSKSGLSLDFRDKYGWTALHWAAYYGREDIVGALLSAGARPNLVTDPTPLIPGGCTASDLAAQKGHNGLAAYLGEEALVDHFNDMALAGNASGSIEFQRTCSVKRETVYDEASCLKDTLAAYRTAADAAARINAAFREQSLKLRTEAVQGSNPEDEARTIISAMKIQHAFRSFESRKKMAAALRIQYGFRTWKTRRDFLNMRQQAIKIQAVFRGFQVRRHYRKIIWSVGVLEKAVLRWRFKRRGFRGLQVAPVQEITSVAQEQENDVEEDFFVLGRKQAEDRVESAVIKVQAMFRSKQAQQEYRRMKLAHNQAKIEYEGFFNHNAKMES
uniref:CG-1 domain-containing protein n=1 Tax=Kalanchoe fedtschenkoi TaxID=63787 RepID=A0A7N0ZRA4_KALFE